MAKSWLEKRQIGKKRKEADERHATLFSFYCLPLRYILTPGHEWRFQLLCEPSSFGFLPLLCEPVARSWLASCQKYLFANPHFYGPPLSSPLLSSLSLLWSTQRHMSHENRFKDLPTLESLHFKIGFSRLMVTESLDVTQLSRPASFDSTILDSNTFPYTQLWGVNVRRSSHSGIHFWS